jgi:hypothetical protein
VVVILLPLLLIPLVDSTSDASTFPILSQINRLNPEGPHFTLPAIRPFVDFGNSAAGYYRGSRHHQGSVSSPSSRFSPSLSSSSRLPPSSLFLASAFPRYLGSSYPRANQVTGFGGAAIGIGPGKYSAAAYRKSEIDPKQRQKKFGSDLTNGKEKIASKLSKSDPEIRILGPKPAASKKPSLYEALRNRANMEARAVPKTAALFKSEAVEVIGNSLDGFPVSFHPEEELARKG